MVQIARGTTGQAESTGVMCTDLDAPWGVFGDDFATGHIIYYSNDGNDWNVTKSGLITIPPDAPPGKYKAYYQGWPSDFEVCVPYDPEHPEIPVFYFKYYYAFQVVPDVYRSHGPGDPICSL